MVIFPDSAAGKISGSFEVVTGLVKFRNAVAGKSNSNKSIVFEFIRQWILWLQLNDFFFVATNVKMFFNNLPNP